MSPDLLVNSLALAALSTTGAVFLGIPVALAMAAAGNGGRRWILGASVIVLMLPPFWVAGQWMQAFGFAGAWRMGGGSWTDRWMPILASAWVLSCLSWPLAAIWLEAAWRRIDPRLGEAWPELTGSRWARHALWPAAAGALPAPVLLTALLAWAQFTVPAVFQARVWPAEMWLQLSTRLDAVAALRIALVPSVVLVAALAWWWRGASRGFEPGADIRPGADWAKRLGPAWRLGSAVSGSMVLGVSFLAPLVASVRDTRLWSELPRALMTSGLALLSSGILAATAATLVVILGAVLVEGRFGRWLGGIIGVAWVLPGMLIGMLLAWAATAPGMGWVQGSTALLVLALTLRYSAAGWLAASRVRAASDPRLEALLRVSGARGWALWRHARWPCARQQFGAAWYLVYLLSLWDVETTLLVVPPGGDTVALVVFNLLHYGYTAQVSALGLWLAVLALAPLVVAWVVGRLLRGRGVRWIGGVALAGLAVTGCSPTSGSSPSSGATSVPLDSKLFERVQVIGTKGTGPGHFNKPRSVTVDREDQLYVVDMTGRVQKFDRSGVWTLLWQMPETDKGKAKGMAGVGDGSVLVVEPHYHRVNRFSATGVLLGQWGHLGTNAGQLWFPRAVAVGPNGDCFVSEYGVVERVQRFRIEDGAFLGGFGNAGDGTAQFNRAEGVGVDRTGRVYVADSCNHRVQVFESDGRWVRSHGRAGPGVGEFGYPYDVQVDAEGHQFVCEFGNSRVQVLDAADRPVDLLGGPGQAPDRMNSPWSLCLDSQGNLYVADSQNHRVLKFVRRRAPVALAEAASNGGRESPLPGIRGTRLPARHDGDRTE